MSRTSFAHTLKKIAFSVALVSAVVASSSCGSDTSVTPTPPSQMAIVSGNNQTAQTGQALKQPLIVRVTAPSGDPVAGQEVDWTIVSGNGSLSATKSMTDATGTTSNTWTVGDAGQPQMALATIAGANAGVPFTATSTSNPTLPEDRVMVVHYDGATWTAALQDNHSVSSYLVSIWGASASAIFAVGHSCDGNFMEHYDGTSWDDTPNCPNRSPFQQLTSVFGNSATDVFAVETGGDPMEQYSSILHYDGTTWTYVYGNRSPASSPPPTLIEAVWSRAANDVFAVGLSGHIVHYDGTAWSDQSTPTAQALTAVWGDKTSSAVFAVGDAGTILRYDGASWTSQTSGTTQPLFAIWGSSATDVYAVGNAGTILHYDGTSWSSQNSGTTQPLHSIWGFSDASVFAVGDSSVVAHYDGTSWASQRIDMRVHFRGVWGSSPSNVFVVGVPR